MKKILLILLCLPVLAAAQTMKVKLKQIEPVTLQKVTTAGSLTDRLMEVSRGTDVFSADYMLFKPTDYGTGKPLFGIAKSGVAGRWNLYTYDGTNFLGEIGVYTPTFKWNDELIATRPWVSSGFIQNQYLSAQPANAWISGDLRLSGVANGYGNIATYNAFGTLCFRTPGQLAIDIGAVTSEADPIYTGHEPGVLRRRQNFYGSGNGLSLDNATVEQGFAYSDGGSGMNGPFISFGQIGGNNNYRMQITSDYGTGSEIHMRTRNGDISSWNPWYRMWTNYDFTSTAINNWQTAYSWGNHALAGYLTSVPSWNSVMNAGNTYTGGTLFGPYRYTPLHFGQSITTGRAANIGYVTHQTNTDSSGVYIANYGDNELTSLFVRKGGNVGIGTAAPTSKFVVSNGSNREIRSFFSPSTPVGELVTGTEYNWYSENLKVGAIRGGSTDITGFGAEFNGVRKMELDLYGNLTAWNSISALNTPAYSSGAKFSAIYNGTSGRFEYVTDQNSNFTLRGTGGEFNSMAYADTRNDNYAPSARQGGLWWDFKDASVMGLGSAYVYAGVLTLSPYNDASGTPSGSNIAQLATYGNRLFTRSGSSMSTWGAWKTLAFVEDLTTPTWQQTLAVNSVASTAPTISVGTNTTSADYLTLKPTDYGTNKPYLSIGKSSTSGRWGISMWDGTSFTGELGFTMPSLKWNEETVATRPWVTSNTIQNQNSSPQTGNWYISGMGIANAIQAGNNAQGKVLLANGAATQSGYIEFYQANQTRNGYIGYQNGRMHYYSDGGSHEFAGKIGIGVTTPVESLEVAGSIKQSGVTSALLKADATGKIVPAVAGVDYLAAINIASGTYTPTFSAVTGVSSVSASGTAMYSRAGNIVTVSGICNITFPVGGAGGASFEISLPISSDLAGNGDASGVGNGPANVYNSVFVQPNVSTNNAQVNLQKTGASGTVLMSYMFMYKVL